MTQLDPIRLEVIRNALIAGAEEMNLSIWRTARSTVVRETLDYSTALFDGEGRAVAQSTRIPIHLNSMSVCLDEIVAGPIPLDQWSEGDVILTNDPYSGGQHLPDFVAFQPIFAEGRRVAISASIVHHVDVGGGAPGSYFAGATEIYQEGLRLPPVKLAENGKIKSEILQIIRTNSREPEKIAGDVHAQVACLAVGQAAILRLTERYGVDALVAAMQEIVAQSERAMRAVISELPVGVYEFEDFVDDDGQNAIGLKVVAQVEVSGDECTVDLSGSADQAPGPVNCTLNMARSGVYCALLCLGEGKVMANSGAYAPIGVICRPGSIVNCLAPAPVANRMATGHRVVTTVLGALAKAVPEKVPAAYYGVSYVAALSAPDPAVPGERRVYFEVEVGGWGGHPTADGADGYSAGFHNLANSPVEMCESLFPITFTEYSLITDSGGAGKHRGGMGLAREWRLNADWGTLSGNFERFRYPPYGLNGGAPGSPGRFVHYRGDEVTELPSKISGLALEAGDRVRLQTSGGGGWGDPAHRDTSKVADDLASGRISSQAAENAYGHQSSD
ncbi:MAG: hydantoinase B/oxoprolinase family protein [Alphaproteobacteria bacterium]|nr:hydantoinase B/oxoprolinase family protein [Alphaproteobacteria bacterium]